MNFSEDLLAKITSPLIGTSVAIIPSWIMDLPGKIITAIVLTAVTYYTHKALQKWHTRKKHKKHE